MQSSVLAHVEGCLGALLFVGLSGIPKDSFALPIIASAQGLEQGYNRLDVKVSVGHPYPTPEYFSIRLGNSDKLRLVSFNYGDFYPYTHARTHVFLISLFQPRGFLSHSLASVTPDYLR